MIDLKIIIAAILKSGEFEVSKWIYKRNNNSNCKCRLFCLPYAGAGASIYAKWAEYVDDDIEVIPIQLPGRENRRNESLCNDAEIVVSHIADAMADLLDKPFAMFGYSMGGILAYELTLKIYEKYKKRPEKLFMSASSVFRDKKPVEVSQMDEEQLVHYMKKSDGMPETILKDDRYRKEYFPVIKNDYSLIERYKFNYNKVPCDIVAFASKEDKEVGYQNVRLLRFFTKKFNMYHMLGNHFFIRNNYEDLGEIVSKELMDVTK